MLSGVVSIADVMCVLFFSFFSFFSLSQLVLYQSSRVHIHVLAVSHAEERTGIFCHLWYFI